MSSALATATEAETVCDRHPIEFAPSSEALRTPRMRRCQSTSLIKNSDGSPGSAGVSRSLSRLLLGHGGAGFKIDMEESGTYFLVVEYATEESRPCDVLLNSYDVRGRAVYPDYPTFKANFATALTISQVLPQPTGGFGPAYLRSTTVGVLDVRKGFNTIHIRRRDQDEPGYQGSGNTPDLGGIKLVREITVQPPARSLTTSA